MQTIGSKGTNGQRKPEKKKTILMSQIQLFNEYKENNLVACGNFKVNIAVHIFFNAIEEQRTSCVSKAVPCIILINASEHC